MVAKTLKSNAPDNTQRFCQVDDHVVSLKQKQQLSNEMVRLKKLGLIEQLPKIVTFFVGIRYGFVSRMALEESDSSVVSLQDDILVPELIKRSGQDDLKAIHQKGKSLFARTSGCTIHHMVEGNTVGLHLDTQTKTRGERLYTVVYNTRITVDGKDTLDPNVREQARKDGRLPVLEVFNAKEQLYQRFELYTGRTLFHSGTHDAHRVPPLKKGVERFCTVVFASENTDKLPLMKKVPKVYSEAVNLYRHRRMMEKVSGRDIPRTGAESMHVILVIGIIVALAVVASIMTGVGVGISKAVVARRAPLMVLQAK